MVSTVADPLPEGWYPDPDNEFLVRWWDGNSWTDHRQTWCVSAQRGGRWYPSKSLNGRFLLFVATHPLLFALVTVTLYLLPAILLPAPVTFQEVVGAVLIAAFPLFLVWRSRSRLRQAHRAFYSGRPWLRGRPA